MPRSTADWTGTVRICLRARVGDLFQNHPMTQPTLNYETTDQSENRARRAIAKLLDIGGRLLALAAVFLFFWWTVPGNKFVTFVNFENILVQSAVYTMAGLGMTMIIIAGGIDLAAGSTIALSVMVTALVLQHGGPNAPWFITPLAIIGGAMAGMAVGALQGTLITGLRVVPFIITLGGLVGIRGLAKNIVHDQEISPPPGWLYHHLMIRVQGKQFSWQLFPLGVWATQAAAVLAAAMLRYTRLGRHIYAIGSSEATARLCGIPVQRTKIAVYAIGGLFAGLAGVLEFSRNNYAQPTGAQMYELYVIAACVIGGASLRGGVGTIFGTVIGSLMIGVLYVGAEQSDWAKYTQEEVIGATIVIAVAVDQLRNRKSRAAG
jgi:ribose/xylose/arabinose/galactoside ABC-type transport system permease subunit